MTFKFKVFKSRKAAERAIRGQHHLPRRLRQRGVSFLEFSE
jgi:hypothetical protein